MTKKEAVAHSNTAIRLPRNILPLTIEEELRCRRVNWKKCNDQTLLKEISEQGEILDLIIKDTTQFKEEVYSNGYSQPLPQETIEEVEVSLSDLEAEVTAMHSNTMVRMPDDETFRSQLAAMRADAAAALEEEEN
jgi:hypothetical protein